MFFLTLFLLSCSQQNPSATKTACSLLQGESFPWAAVPHKLPALGPFHGLQSVLRNEGLSCGSPTGSLSRWQTCSSVGSSLRKATGPARSRLQPGLPKVHSLQASLCSSVGSSIGCRWISAPLLISIGGRGTAASPVSTMH